MPEDLIAGQSIMAELVRTADWAATPLGALNTWSATLLSQVNLLLCSQSPATLSWGDSLTFFYNDEAIPTLGIKHPRALGKAGKEVFPEAWHVMGPEMDACYLRGEIPIHENVCIPLLRNGSVEDAYFNYGLIPVYEHGVIAGVRGVHENTTEKMCARLERDAIALELAQVLDATSDGVVSLNGQWHITYMNPRAKELLQADDSALGSNLWKTFPYHFYPGSPCVTNLERAMYQRIGTTFETSYEPPLNVTVMMDVRPARGGIVVFIRDITEQKKAEQQLQDSESRERIRLLELFENAPVWLALLTGPEHVFEMVNTAYREMMGNRELIGQRVIDCVPEVIGTGWIELLDNVYRTGVPHLSSGASFMRSLIPGGPLEERILDYVYQPRRRDDGSVFGIIAMGTDVTDQRRAERALIQSEKLAVVGRLASSIAHEINNPLGAAMNYLYLAGVSDDLKDVRESVESARAELNRVSVISTQTLLSQKQTSTPSATTFEEITNGVLYLYQGRIKTSRIAVLTKHHGACRLVCIEGEIRQVMGNLIGNAIDAMSRKGGRLWLRSREATDWKTGRKGCRATIADTGEGIAPDALQHIFAPFFTTKGALGNGLGLWIAQEIVARHHGEIRFRSATGPERNGTVFTLFLPESSE